MNHIINISLKMEMDYIIFGHQIHYIFLQVMEVIQEQMDMNMQLIKFKLIIINKLLDQL